MKIAKMMVLLALAGVVVLPAAAAEKKAPAKKAAAATKAAPAKKAEPKVDVWASLPANVAEIDGVAVTKGEIISGAAALLGVDYKGQWIYVEQAKFLYQKDN